MTDVTIRGIDDETYAQFAAEAKKRGLAIGELTTLAMRTIISESSEPVYKIGGIEYLTVTKEDLQSIEAQVIFSDIELLEFDQTVDWNIFKERVKEIKDVELLRLPKGLSKFQVLTRSKDIEMIQTKS